MNTLCQVFQRCQQRFGLEVNGVNVVDGLKRSPNFVRKEGFESSFDDAVGRILFDADVPRPEVDQFDGGRGQLEAQSRQSDFELINIVLSRWRIGDGDRP